MAIDSSPQSVAVITGAGSGIGRATAMLLARRGMKVALLGRTVSKIQSVRDQLVQAGTQPSDVMTIGTDVADHRACAAAISQVDHLWHRVDVLVNVAGIAPSLGIDAMDINTWQQVLAINLSGPFFLMKAVWPIFRRQFAAAAGATSGVVVNISSLAARDPFDGFAAYAAAKAGLNLLSLSAAREAEAFGARVHVIAPGAVETELFRSLVTEQDYPSSKTLSPQAVAEAISSCIDGPLSHANGEVIWFHQRLG